MAEHAPLSSEDAPAASVVNDLLKREYWCFISYRHADNKEPGRQWATWLHQTLETYEVPADLVGTKNQRGDVIPERIFPVFRDEEELPADASLSTPIEAALQNSRFLVVLCSPNAVRSTFVADEILRFKQLGKQDRILAAILYGEPTLAANMERECFPKPLRHAIDEHGQLIDKLAEPIAADFRLHDGGQGWTSPAAYRASLKAGGVSDRAANEQVEQYLKQQNLMLLKIVAGVLGVPLGVLTARDKAYQMERQKQRAKVLRRWLGVVSALAVAALIAGVLAVRNANEAKAQRDQVAAKSQELSDTLGAAYFREGSARLKDQRTALEGLAYLARAVREHAHPTSARRLLTFLQQRDVWVAEDAGAAPPAPPAKEGKAAVPAFVTSPSSPLTENKEPGKFDRVVKGPNGLVAVSWCEDVDSPEGSNHAGTGLHHFRVWDAEGKPLCDWTKPDADADHWVGNISGMTFSPDGTWIAITVQRWRQPEYLQVWDFRRAAQVGETLEATGKHPNYQGAVFTTVSFTPEQQDTEGRHCSLLAGSSRGDAYWLDITRPQDPAADAYTNSAVVVSHHAAIRAVLLLRGTEKTLVTASDDAEVWFTSAPGDLERAGVPVLKLDQPVDAISPDAGGGVMLRVGDRLHRATKVPAQSLAGRPEARPRLHVYTGEGEDRGVRVTRFLGEDEKTIFEGTAGENVMAAHAQEEPAGMSLEGAGGAVTAFLLQDDGQAQMVADGRGSQIVIDPKKGAHKQTLRGLVADMRSAGQGDAVVALTRQFEYQIFDLATGRHLSQPLDESVFFTQDHAASELDAAMLSQDRAVLLTRSLHHEPPNVDRTWTMLWDCASGEPLSDRLLFTDSGLEEPVTTREPYINNETANVEGMLLHQAKPALYPILAELGESLAGLQLDAAGELRPVKRSHARVTELLQKLAQMSR